MRGEDVRGECAGEVRGLARLPSIFFLVLPPLPRAAIKVRKVLRECAARFTQQLRKHHGAKRNGL